MAFGFPAYYKKELKLSDTEGFREELVKALAELPFSMLQMSKERVILKAGWSVWS